MHREQKELHNGKANGARRKPAAIQAAIYQQHYYDIEESSESMRYTDAVQTVHRPPKPNEKEEHKV